jgi:hypothetical protein
MHGRVKTTGANQAGTAMLAEIFMLRLEALARAAEEARATSSRFVPITLPIQDEPLQPRSASRR